MRKIAVLLVLIAAGAVLPAAQNRSLRFVSPVRPPFTDAAPKPRFALDLVEAALQRINVSATTTLVPNGEYGNALLNGSYDGTAVAWRDSARETALLFSEPYLENRLVLAGRKGADVSAKTLADLKGNSIAIINGYAYGDENLTAGPRWVRTNGELDSLRMLLDGKVDYVLMDDLVVQYIVNDYPEEARTRLSIGTLPLLIRPVHLALHRSLPDAAAIIKGFNAQIRQMILDRTYHKLLHVDWIYTDVDGDGRKELISADDQAGKTAPQRAYNLFSQSGAEAQLRTPEQERYFFGGAVYSGWSSVPDKYKTDYLDRPEHVHPTARVFTFSWK
jgi:polar amino acid transport system substrate-binding protein